MFHLNWVLVLIAGLLEVVWASSLKHADSLLDWIIIFILIAISFLLLIRSYRKIPMAAAYTVFVGIGTVGTYMTGIVLGESFSSPDVLFSFVARWHFRNEIIYERKQISAGR